MLVRSGYGSAFNNLYISETTITKTAKNEYGLSKIKKEIAWYRFCEETKIDYPRPEINRFMENGYTMKYYSEYVPLYRRFSLFTDAEKFKMLDTIYTHLKVMHDTTEKEIDKETFMRNVKQECYDKIINRFKEIEEMVKRYSYITHVNGMPILDFHTLAKNISASILNYYDGAKSYSVSCIHGDCQFNNILVSPNSSDIIFIDPRGYFGESAIFGPADYDKAKVQFALSGYDIFDNMDITILNVENNNLTIPDLFQVQEPLKRESIRESIRGSIITDWVLSIWLGNAHSFKSNEAKAMFSYFYALYLGTLYGAINGANI